MIYKELSGESLYQKANQLLKDAKDHDKEMMAFNIMNMAAQKGHPYAIATIGTWYEDGIIVEQNIMMAIRYYEEGLNSLNPIVLFKLGKLTLNMNDERSFKLANLHFLQAIDSALLDIFHGYDHPRTLLLNSFHMTEDDIDRRVMLFAKSDNCDICKEKIYPSLYETGIDITSDGFTNIPEGIIKKYSLDEFVKDKKCCPECNDKYYDSMKDLIDRKLLKVSEIQKVFTKDHTELSISKMIKLNRLP